MREINLQDLLLDSMNTGQEQSYRKVVYLGGRCFVFVFRVTGKTLIFDDIKTRKPTKRQTSIERFHKRWRNLKRRHLKYRAAKPKCDTMERSSSCSSILAVAENSDNFSQTEPKEICNRGTYTSKLFKRMIKKSQECQTKQSYSESDFKLTQTEEKTTTSIGIETFCLMSPCGVGTENFEFHASSQTEPHPFRHIHTQTDGDTDDYNKISVDEPMVLFMLNEIGEISTTNRDLTEKNIQVSTNVFELLSKIVNAQKLQLSILQPLTKCGAMLGPNKFLLSEATQTETANEDKETQTKVKHSCWKRFRYISCFRTR